MKKYMNPEMNISYFSREFVRTDETPTYAPVTESSFTVGAQDVYNTVVTGGGNTTNAMQKSAKFQDAMGYK